MHRQILEACLPSLLALAASFAALVLLVRLSGARLCWRRLRDLHSCQDGGVQSLAFVLTLPLFIVITLFIVQVSQLMIGTMVVNYAAFATARAASVWIAADTELLAANKMLPPLTEDAPLVLTNMDSTQNSKYEKIFQAAAMACAPICPSRDLGYQPNVPGATNAADVLKLYRAMVPESQTNARLPQRLQNKLSYSAVHTTVRLEFVDKDTRTGPTYNPRMPRRLPSGEFVRVWDPHEVGWQDPVTVTVTHQFALLPGPGRFLAKFLVRADGRPDTVSPRIGRSQVGARPYVTPIWASATLTNEGFKSVKRYVQDTDQLGTPVERDFFAL